jgi:ZIP family zinc transporter
VTEDTTAAGDHDGGTGSDAPDDPISGDVPRWVMGILPLILVVLVIGLFVATNPLGDVESGQALPDVAVSHVEIPDSETLVVHVVNNGPDSVTVAQVLVDEAYWGFDLEGAGGDRTLEPMERARLVIPYHTTAGFDYDITVISAEGATFHHTVVAASPAPGFSLDLLGTLALIGLFVGVIPVALGMLWFPYISTMGERWLHAVLMFAVGILTFLAIDAGFEALELAEQVPGAYDGPILVALGVLGTLLLVQTVSAWRAGRVAAGEPRASRGLWIAYLVAFGIGLHNLAEGLAIGSAFALGRVSLGAFLVVGFMLHNVTEGPAVVAPVARGERPAWWHFGLLGLLAGGPVILGGWIGSLAYSPTLGALFLAVGVGAILQVDWEITAMVRRAGGRVASATNLLAVGLGIATMYLTDLLVGL